MDLPVGQLTHVLRHTFASHYMMNGGDIITLQRVLGHASLAMTMKYAHFSPGHLAEVVTLNPLTVVQSGRMAKRGESDRASETVNADHFREPADLAGSASKAGVELSEAS